VIRRVQDSRRQLTPNFGRIFGPRACLANILPLYKRIAFFKATHRHVIAIVANKKVALSALGEQR
jgi:hypothetical protein